MDGQCQEPLQCDQLIMKLLNENRACLCRAGKNLALLEKVFRLLGVFKVFIGFFYILVYKDDWTQNSDVGRTFYTPFSLTVFSINYNKTHKSRLKYEIKCDLYKISPNIKKPKFWSFGFFKT